MTSGRLSVFPAFHKVTGRIVAVVGDGAAAAAKVRLLGETDALIRVVAEAPSAELAALLLRPEIEHRAHPFRAVDLEGAVLVFAASGDAAADAEVVAAARARNIPANAVDIPELCDFYTPAIVNRAPVAVAITSTGAGPVLAQNLRARIEAMLPPQLGSLARLGETFRAAADQVLPKGQPRRRFWASFFGGGVADAVYAGRPDEARRLASRLLTQSDPAASGFVWLVGAGPGVADLLTLRAQRLLQEADVIVHDSEVAESVVSMGRRDAARMIIGRREGSPAQDGQEIGALLVREASAGRRVVLLVPGDAIPAAMADDVVSALRAAGIAFDLVPGIPAPRSEREALVPAQVLAA